MIFDTKNPENPRKRAEDFQQELTDILDSIEAVKGPDYAAAVQNIFCSQNVHTGIFYVIAKIMKETGAVADMTHIQRMVREVEESLMHDMAHLLIPVLIGRKIQAGGPLTMPNCSVIIEDLKKDVETLVRKQDEYNLGAKGT